MSTRRKGQRSAPRSPATAGQLDKLIHERMRLGIVSALAAGGPLSFTELKNVLDASDGNLSVHARKLEDAGFLSCRKSFDDRSPRTEYELTPAGRAALEKYLGQMEAIIDVARGG
jgi:DNA-binding HxlR family transcriptional regulator